MHSKPIVYACSGCSDAGEIADQAARQLARNGVAEMSCVVGIGGRVKPLLQKCERAENILVIDGCPLACARHSLELAGFNRFECLNLHQLGIFKSACPVTPAVIAHVTAAAEDLLAKASASISALVSSIQIAEKH